MSKSKTVGWYLHRDHGFMLRGAVDADGLQVVVTSLLNNNRTVEADPERWKAQALRLRVNAGCGQVCAETMAEGDHNQAFRRVGRGRVPAHIVEAFERQLF